MQNTKRKNRYLYPSGLKSGIVGVDFMKDS
jgi:hypothetical protein